MSTRLAAVPSDFASGEGELSEEEVLLPARPAARLAPRPAASPRAHRPLPIGVFAAAAIGAGLVGLAAGAGLLGLLAAFLSA